MVWWCFGGGVAGGFKSKTGWKKETNNLLYFFQIAAQNCRKRKIDQISCLETDLSLARTMKESILSERVELLGRKQELEGRMARLENDILFKMGKEDMVITVDNNMLVLLERKPI